ncbi:MAG: iron-sulfur cluster assembly scaffold protein [bacterium]|nr:iron-sulfur cluster assembly scaffold protein [bacterium]
MPSSLGGYIFKVEDIAITRLEMKELYTNEIMSFAAHIPHIGLIEGAQGSGSAHSRLCGSRINVWLNMEEGVVTEFSQEVKACLVGQASASMLSHNIIGCSRQEIAQTRETVRLMLEEEGTAPVGKWQAYELLIPVRNYKSRISTVLIAFDAVLDAMDMALENKEASNV